jgi:hypothetical protein
MRRWSSDGLATDPREVRRTAKRHLGRLLAAAASGEVRLLARNLRSAEEITAMTLAAVHGERALRGGRLLVTTDQRLLLLEKALLPRREQVTDVPWAWVEVLEDKEPVLKIARPEQEIRLALGGLTKANDEVLEQVRLATHGKLAPGRDD